MKSDPIIFRVIFRKKLTTREVTHQPAQPQLHARIAIQRQGSLNITSCLPQVGSGGSDEADY